jgi:hypothetical protein
MDERDLCSKKENKRKDNRKGKEDVRFDKKKCHLVM